MRKQKHFKRTTCLAFAPSHQNFTTFDNRRIRMVIEYQNYNYYHYIYYYYYYYLNLHGVPFYGRIIQKNRPRTIRLEIFRRGTRTAFLKYCSTTFLAYVYEIQRTWQYTFCEKGTFLIRQNFIDITTSLLTGINIIPSTFFF